MTSSPVREGEVLAGKYRVERILGMGGMGVVVAATHLDLLELRALKFMLPTALDNAEAVERFLREARAAARLRNEHVAKIHDVGYLDNGAPYMVMEYLAGADLGSILKQRGPLPAHEVALYAIQACSALAEAHTSGIIHRDLKPANLFLTLRPDGSPCIKVLDFGISKVSGAGSDFEMTKTHAVLGSPHYMSPEQMRSARNVDARSDVWSLGVILYKLTTGKAPFRGQNITELISAVLEGAPPPPSQVRAGLPIGLDAVIARCLSRKPEARYQSVNELAQALIPFAPAGAGAAPDPMARLLASVAPETRARLDSVLTTTGTPSLPSILPVPPPAPTYAAPSSITPMPGLTAMQGQGGEPTFASWGKTESSRAARSRLILALAGLVGVAGLLAMVLVIRVILTRGSTPQNEASAGLVEPSASASVVATASASAPAVTIAAARPDATVEPVISVASATAAASAAPRRAAPTPPVASAPKATGAPKVTPPSGSDPFGRGRK
ncbi:MAG: serine/threonine-protein kinase [Byssovorax sp.]